MYHKLFLDASFWTFLFSIDQDLAQEEREKGCSCGGKLHGANYLRKPRGPKKLEEKYRYRLSFCCDQDGCRKRKTPPSVRFLGRKVYLGAVVILVSAMRQGDTPTRIGELTRLFGVDRQTIDRWRNFWNDLFPQTQFWREANAHLVPVFEITAIPWSLVQAFVHKGKERVGWGNLLRFLAPITITGGLKIADSAASLEAIKIRKR